MSDLGQRMPRVGDLIVNKDPGTGSPRRFGLVHKIEKDKHGGSYVFIEWADGESYQTYASWQADRGYPSCNIFNLRREFDVIRDGVNIP